MIYIVLIGWLNMRIKSIQRLGRSFFLCTGTVRGFAQTRAMPLLRVAFFMGALFASSVQATVAIPQPVAALPAPALLAPALPAIAPAAASGMTPAVIPAPPVAVTPPGVPVAALNASVSPAVGFALPLPAPVVPAGIAAPVAAASIPQAPQMAVPGAVPIATAPLNAVAPSSTDLDEEDEEDEEDEDDEEQEEDEDGDHEEDAQNNRRGKKSSCPCPVAGKDRSFITALRKNAMELEPVKPGSRRFEEDWTDDNRSAAAVVSAQETSHNMGAGASGFFDTLLGFAGTKLEEKLDSVDDDEDDEDEAI